MLKKPQKTKTKKTNQQKTQTNKHKKLSDQQSFRIEQLWQIFFLEFGVKNVQNFSMVQRKRDYQYQQFQHVLET